MEKYKGNIGGEYCCYGDTEFYLNRKFIVHHLFRDTRHDDGDDAGYIVAICEANDIFYLHIIEVCQYNQLDNTCLSKAELEERGGFPDYIICDSVEDAQLKLNKLLDLLDKFHKEDGDSSRDSEAFLRHLKDISDDEAEWLSVLSFPYSEFPQDRIALLKLSKTEYVPDFDNREFPL